MRCIFVQLCGENVFLLDIERAIEYKYELWQSL